MVLLVFCEMKERLMTVHAPLEGYGSNTSFLSRLLREEVFERLGLLRELPAD